MVGGDLKHCADTEGPGSSRIDQARGLHVLQASNTPTEIYLREARAWSGLVILDQLSMSRHVVLMLFKVK